MASALNMQKKRNNSSLEFTVSSEAPSAMRPSSQAIRIHMSITSTQRKPEKQKKKKTIQRTPKKKEIEKNLYTEYSKSLWLSLISSGVRRIFEKRGRAGNLRIIKTQKRGLHLDSARFSAQI